METIQPGDGYTFSASSSGFNLNIEKPWTPPADGGLYFGFEFPNVPNIPEQLVNAPMAVIRPSPFECRIVSVNGERFLQMACGSIGFSQSNMPIIYNGAFTRISQGQASKIQICPDGMRETGNIYPGGNPGTDPSYSVDWWTEEGGGYRLADASEPFGIYAFKWDVDINVPPFQDSDIVNTGIPTLALIMSDNATDKAKIEKATGPSIYENTMNVQKMEGYTAAETELPGDWGHCHTTWFNPRKIGYNLKTIATVGAVSNTFTASASIVRPAVPLLQNMIQSVNFSGVASGGAVTISCGGFTSTVPFPVTNFYSATVPVYSNELTLKACLESIVAFLIPGIELPFTMLGNVEVSKYSDNTYYVSFVNQLQGIAVPPLTINTAGVTAYEWDFKITQYHTGSIDLTTPMQFGMTQLMNEADVTEAVDPYNLNKDGDPEWKDIINREDVIGCTDFSGDVIFDGIQIINDIAGTSPDYTKVAGCTDEPDSMHPFKVIYEGEVDGSSTYSIVSGTVNNVVPQNITATFAVTGVNQVWIQMPFINPDFPKNNTDFKWEIGPTLPNDTDAFGYVRVAEVNGTDITQFVTGSLWADRIKMGSQTATYFYARV